MLTNEQKQFIFCLHRNHNTDAEIYKKFLKRFHVRPGSFSVKTVLLNMGKGQARTKANMRKLAMLEQQNSSNSSMPPLLAVADGPPKKASRAKAPKNKKSLENGESLFMDIKTPESSLLGGDSLLNDKSPEKKRRGRKPKNSTSPDDPPVEKKRRQSKKSLSLGNQDSVPINGDALPVKPPRKPRKKKEVLPIQYIKTESITSPFQDPQISVLHVEQPKVKSPRGKNRKKKSENFVLETMPVTNSPEKEYTLQIPEVNDNIPTNTVKIVQTIKLPKAEKKGKIPNNNSMQERKAVLEEEVAQALLDLQDCKNGPPSPLKIVEAPTTMLELYENTNEVHGIKVKKSLNVIDKKAITPKVKTPKISKKRKSALDTPDTEIPIEPKRKKSNERKEKFDSPVGKRRKSSEVKESPAQAKKRKLLEAKEKSLVERKKSTPKTKISKARVSRSPKIIAGLPQSEISPVTASQDQEPFPSVEQFSKNGKPKKNKKAARLSVDVIPGANNIVAPATTPAFDITIAPIFSNGAAVAKVTIASPLQVKGPPQIPIKALTPNQMKVEATTSPVAPTQIPAKVTTPTPVKSPIKATSSPAKTSPVKASTPIQAKDKSPSTAKAAASKASSTPLLPVNIDAPSNSEAPISFESPSLPIKTKAKKSKKIANPVKAPRVNKKKVSTSKSTTKSPTRTKTIESPDEETPSPTKRKGKNSVKSRTAASLTPVKAATDNPTKTNSSNSAKSVATTKASKNSQAGTIAPSPKAAASNTAKNALSAKLSSPVLDKDIEAKSSPVLPNRRRSSTSSRTAFSAATNSAISAPPSVIPVTSGPPSEPEPQSLSSFNSYLPPAEKSSSPVVSSITATASKIIKKRNSKSRSTFLSFNSADAIISSVSSGDTGLPDLEPIITVAKTAASKSNAKNNISPTSLITTSEESSPLNNLPVPPVQIIKEEKKAEEDLSKVRTRRPRRKMSPVIPKPEPFQLTSQRKQHIPTVFVKQSPLGNTSKGNTEKEKHVGPSLRVVEGKVKFYRGSDEEDNDAEPKLPREKAPVEFDESVPWTCVFCQLGPQVERLGDLFGPYYVKQDEKKGKVPGKRETWVHEECAVWAHKVLLIGSTLRNLDEAVYFGDREKCIICGLIGATVGCLRRGCTKAVHVPCAKSNSWKLDAQTMHSFCPDHI